MTTAGRDTSANNSAGKWVSWPTVKVNWVWCHY